MEEEKWVIAGMPDGSVPEVGATYEVRHSRKGVFTGVIEAVNGPWATIRVTEGEPKFAGTDYKVSFWELGTLEIRATLSYLIKVEKANELDNASQESTDRTKST